MQSIARKGKMQIWTESLREDSKRVAKLTKSYQTIERHLEKIKSNPADTAANQAIGEFYCFDKEDWPKGLPFLAKGSNAKLKSLIADQNKSNATVKELIQVADRWLVFDTAAENRDAIQNYALAIYQQIAKKAKGIEKKQLEEKILSLAKSGGGQNIVAVYANRWQVTWAKGHPKWEWAAFSRDGKFRCFAIGKTWDNEFQMIGNTIKMTNPANKYFMQVKYNSGRLICRKIDTKTNRVLDQGVGVPIK